MTVIDTEEKFKDIQRLNKTIKIMKCFYADDNVHDPIKLEELAREHLAFEDLTEIVSETRSEIGAIAKGEYITNGVRWFMEDDFDLERTNYYSPTPELFEWWMISTQYCMEEDYLIQHLTGWYQPH